jgi:thiamine-monophosphate kinase
VLTTDLLVEDVHFIRRWQPPRSVGWKALARSLSMSPPWARDLSPHSSPGVPADTPNPGLGIFRGIDVLARRLDVRVIGGDLSSAPGGR